jgi:hypothetical protein
MLTEAPLQIDLFTGELVDTRTAAQRHMDAERQRPAQMSLFSAAEHVELSLPARPWLDELPAPLLELIILDTRTEEEKERDQLRAAQKLTVPLFSDIPTVESSPPALAPTENIPTPETNIPILWTSRADMLKRRPDLADTLNHLHNDQLEDLAGLIGQALEEFYWMQLNVVLSLYLDHDLRLTRVVRRRSSPTAEPPSPPVPAMPGIILTHCP